ncbi:hypothetical protein LTR85_003630 [Meristemomyces frigidus]|nr:hypothetical protein LTR85_003630 [Meristemomyces frigidus]
MLCLFTNPPYPRDSPWINHHPDTPSCNNYDTSNIDRISSGPNAVSPPPVLVPPGLPALNVGHLPNPPWPGFLTRVCDDCEQLIQTSRWNRSVSATTPGLAPNLGQNPMTTNEWESYPDNSCTCCWNLGLMPGSPKLCHSHRRQVWDKLEKTKDDNDRWLRSITSSSQRGVGLTILATAAAKAQRNARGFWGACRCGKELPDPNGLPGQGPRPPPEAYICMACEGHVSVVDPYLMTSRCHIAFPNRWYYLRMLPARKITHLRSARSKLRRRVANR